MRKKAFQTLKMILSMALAGLLLYFAFKGIDWKEFAGGVRETHWVYILLSLVVAFIALVLRTLRWLQQISAIDPDARFRKVWDGYNIGNFLNLIIPGIGEFYRCAHATDKKTGYDKVFGTVLMERAWDVLAIAILLIGAVVCNADVLLPFMKEHVMGPFLERFNISLWWCMAILMAVFSALVAGIFIFREKNSFLGKCADTIDGTLKGVLAFKEIQQKGMFLLYTVGIWLMYILMTYFTFKAIPGLQNLNFSDSVFISAVGNIASVIPTPGNLGAYHYLVGLAISSIYLGASEILAKPLLFATLSHGSHAILLVFMGIISYIAVGISQSNNRKK